VSLDAKRYTSSAQLGIIVKPMSYLYGVKFVGPIDPLVISLRDVREDPPQWVRD
jgi:hypothetical protein